MVRTFFPLGTNSPRYDWGRLDSNQRIHKESDLQSDAIGRYATPPKMTRLSVDRRAILLEKGIEPSTIRLQVGRSTN